MLMNLMSSSWFPAADAGFRGGGGARLWAGPQTLTARGYGGAL